MIQDRQQFAQRPPLQSSLYGVQLSASSVWKRSRSHLLMEIIGLCEPFQMSFVVKTPNASVNLLELHSVNDSWTKYCAAYTRHNWLSVFHVKALTLVHTSFMLFAVLEFWPPASSCRELCYNEIK